MHKFISSASDRDVPDAFFRTGSGTEEGSSKPAGSGTGFRFIPDSGIFRNRIPVPDYSGYQYFPVTVKTASIRNVNLSQVRCHFTLELKN
jgi:hypothetical protein